jgi:hypothetical protein
MTGPWFIICILIGFVFCGVAILLLLRDPTRPWGHWRPEPRRPGGLGRAAVPTTTIGVICRRRVAEEVSNGPSWSIPAKEPGWSGEP